MQSVRERPALGRVSADCLVCAARLVGLCAPLDPPLLELLASDAQRSSLLPRQAIFLQGDPARHVFILSAGAARLTRLLPDGRRAAVGFRLAGDLLGFTPLPEYPFGAEALGPASVCRLERHSLDSLIARHPVIERRLLDLCMDELASTQEQLLALGRFTAEERVAAFLLTALSAQARRGRAGAILDLPATRGDLGELLGLTLETVSRVFSAFRRRGWIRLHGSTGVEIRDAAALGCLARGEERAGTAA